MKFCVAEVEATKKMRCPYVGACMGSGCMMWRWVVTHVKNPDAPEGDLISSDDTHGVCGLAGYPAENTAG